MVDVLLQRYVGLCVMLTMCCGIGLGPAPYLSLKWLVAMLLVVGLVATNSFVKTPYFWVFLCLWLVPVIRVVWLTDLPGSLSALQDWALIGVAFIVGPRLSFKRRLREGLWWAAILSAIYGLLQMAGVDVVPLDSGRQAISFWGNAQDHAAFLVLAAVLSRRPTNNTLRRCGELVILMGLLLTHAKAALLAWLIFLVLKSQWRSWWQKSIIAGLFLVLVGWVFTDVGPWLTKPLKLTNYVSQFNEQPSLIQDRDAFFRGKSHSLMVRRSLSEGWLRALGQVGGVGVGLGQFRSVYPKYAEPTFDLTLDVNLRPRSTHNFLMDACFLFGLPWTLIASIWVWVWLKSTRSPIFGKAFLVMLLLFSFSSSYLNIVIPFCLLLIAPKSSIIREPWRLSVSLGFVLVAVISTSLLWLPASSKLGAYIQADQQLDVVMRGQRPDQAWPYMEIVWARDPWGPETIYRLSVLSLQVAEGPDSAEAMLGVHGLWWLAHYVPRYDLTNERITELNRTPAWRDLSGEVVALKRDRYDDHRQLQKMAATVLAARSQN